MKGRLRIAPKTNLPQEEVFEMIDQVSKFSKRVVNTIIRDHVLVLQDLEKEERYEECTKIQDTIEKVKALKEETFNQIADKTDEEAFSSYDEALYRFFEMLHTCEVKEEGRVMRNIYDGPRLDEPMLRAREEYGHQCEDGKYFFTSYLFLYKDHDFICHEEVAKHDIQTTTTYKIYQYCDCKVEWNKLDMIDKITNTLDRMLNFYRTTSHV